MPPFFSKKEPAESLTGIGLPVKKLFNERKLIFFEKALAKQSEMCYNLLDSLERKGIEHEGRNSSVL